MTTSQGPQCLARILNKVPVTDCRFQSPVQEGTETRNLHSGPAEQLGVASKAPFKRRLKRLCRPGSPRGGKVASKAPFKRTETHHLSTPQVRGPLSLPRNQRGYVRLQSISVTASRPSRSDHEVVSRRSRGCFGRRETERGLAMTAGVILATVTSDGRAPPLRSPCEYGQFQPIRVAARRPLRGCR